MRKVSKEIIGFIINSNLFIAFGAVSMIWETELLNGIAIKIDMIVLLTFSATVFFYLLQRFIAIKPSDSAGTNMKAWLWHHKSLSVAIMIISALLVGFSFLFVSNKVRLILIIMGVLTLGYGVPVFNFKDKPIRLRDWGMGKTLIVAIVWTGMTAVIPLADRGLAFTDTSFLLSVLERFLFILGITIPFDIRDIEYDLSEIYTHTIPMIIGIKSTKKLAYLIMVLFTITCAIHYLLLNHGSHYSQFAGLLFANLFTIVLIGKIKKDSPEIYYTGVLDGTILIQFLFVLLFTCLF